MLPPSSTLTIADSYLARLWLAFLHRFADEGGVEVDLENQRAQLDTGTMMPVY